MPDEKSNSRSETSEAASKVREFAEKGVDQARDAVGTLLDAARSAAEAIQSTTKTAENPAGQAVQKGFGYAKENIAAIFDFAQKLVKAPDLKQAVEMQSEFIQAQTAIMKKQVEELKEVSAKGDETPSGTHLKGDRS